MDSKTSSEIIVLDKYIAKFNSIHVSHIKVIFAGLHSIVCSTSDCRSSGQRLKSQLKLIDHEIISTVILPLQLIQEGQLSVTSESM